MTYRQAVQVSVGKGAMVIAPVLATRKREGKQFVIALSGPLTDGCLADGALLDLSKMKDGPALIVVNEFLVRGNLPAATADVQEGILR